MIGRGDGDGIQRGVGQCLAEIFEALGRPGLIFSRSLHPFGQGTVIHVANIGDFHPRQAAQAFNVGQAATIGANHRDADPIVWTDFASFRARALGFGFAQRAQQARQAQANPGGSGLFQKFPALDGIIHNG